MMGALPMALKRTTTLEESFFLYVSSAVSAWAGYMLPLCAGIDGEAGDSRLASMVVDAIFSNFTIVYRLY